jgi:hypothetical protein
MNLIKNRKPLIAAAIVAGALFCGACTDDKNESATERDEQASAQALDDLQSAHPTPSFERSQLRQNLIDIIGAQANATQTTSFFFLEGVGSVGSCPSIGFPIPSTAQLTNPDRETGPRESRVVLPQVEPTGIYTGDSTGTYIICVDAQGEAYARYWEGYVQTVTGPAELDANGEVILVGPPSFDFSNGE